MNPDKRLDHGGQWVDAKVWPQAFQSKPKALYFKSLPFTTSSSPCYQDDGSNSDDDNDDEEEGERNDIAIPSPSPSPSSPCTPPPAATRARRSKTVMIKNKGGLSQHEPSAEDESRSFTFVHDPSDPVPTIGGNITSGEPLMVGGAFDQVEREDFFGCKNPGGCFLTMSSSSCHDRGCPARQLARLYRPQTITLF